MLTLWRALFGIASTGPYVGPLSMREFFPFYTYGPTVPATVQMTLGTRLRLWWAARQSLDFVVDRDEGGQPIPRPETSEWWTARWDGDCASYAFLLRDLCQKLGLPEGALRLAFCTTGARPNGGTSDGHMVLTVETDRGCYACDVVFRQWRPWKDFGYHDWNRECSP